MAYVYIANGYAVAGLHITATYYSSDTELVVGDCTWMIYKLHMLMIGGSMTWWFDDLICFKDHLEIRLYSYN